MPVLSGAHVFFYCPFCASFISIFSLPCGRLCYNPGLLQLRWQDGSFNLLGRGQVFGVWIALVHILIIFKPSYEFLKWEIPRQPPGSFSLAWQLSCSFGAARETSYSQQQGSPLPFGREAWLAAQGCVHIRACTGTHCLIHYFFRPSFTY